MTSRAALFAVSLLALPGLGASCGPGGDKDAGVDCGALGLTLDVLAPGGSYLPFASAAEAELVLGFQGFKYVYLKAHLGARPQPPSGAVIIELDGAARRSQPFGDLGLADDGAGGLVSAPVRVFFNDDPLPMLVNKGVTLTLQVGAATCAASAGGRVTLYYDASCYEGPDGQRVCVDAGMAPVVDAPPAADAPPVVDGAP